MSQPIRNPFARSGTWPINDRNPYDSHPTSEVPLSDIFTDEDSDGIPSRLERRFQERDENLQAPPNTPVRDASPKRTPPSSPARMPSTPKKTMVRIAVPPQEVPPGKTLTYDQDIPTRWNKVYFKGIQFVCAGCQSHLHVLVSRCAKCTPLIME